MDFKRDSTNKQIYNYKLFVLVYCSISFLLSIAIFTLALWTRFDWDFKHWIHELQAYQIWTGAYVLLAASVVCMVVAIFGCYATLHENTSLLTWLVCSTAMVMVLEMAGLAYTLDHGTFRSKITPWMEDRFMELIHESSVNERSARILRILQNGIQCCGANDWLDYANYNKEVPAECRNQDTGNLHDLGCSEQFSQMIEPRTGWMSAIALFLFVYQILVLIAIIQLKNFIHRAKDLRQQYAPVHSSSI